MLGWLPRLVIVSSLAICVLLACQSSVPEGPFDLEGTPVDPFASQGRAQVLIFTRSDCPIANRYAPELSRLHGQFSTEGVAFWLVYPDDRENAESIQAHLKEFGYPLTPLRDPGQVLVRKTGVTTSPEAAVFNSQGRLVYRGRIDDRFPSLGITRPPSERDLERAIEAVVSGTAGELVTTTAVGCYLSDLH